MSVRLMAMVFDLDPVKYGASKKITLLSLANYSNDEGISIYPAVDRMAHDTGLDERTVRRLLIELREQDHIIKMVGTHPRYGTNEYELNLDVLQGEGNRPPRGGRSAPQGRAPRPEGEGATPSDPSLNHHITTSKPHSAAPAAGISTVENEWAGTPPQVVQVPQGGNKARKAEYTERCDQCQGTLTQEADACPECGRPVKWEGSTIADKRERTASHRASDLKAKQARDNAERLSTTTSFVLGLARATSPTRKAEFAADEEQALFQYEQAYGAKLVQDKANEFKAGGDRGRGLIKHLLSFLQVYNPGMSKPKGGEGRLILDPDELEKHMS